MWDLEAFGSKFTRLLPGQDKSGSKLCFPNGFPGADLGENSPTRRESRVPEGLSLSPWLFPLYRADIFKDSGSLSRQVIHFLDPCVL